MQITINRDGQQYGPFSLEQINAGLAAGQLVPTDMAWHEGLPEWIPLAELEGVELPGEPIADVMEEEEDAREAPAPIVPTARIVHARVANTAAPSGKRKLALWGGIAAGVLVVGVVVWLVFLREKDGGDSAAKNKGDNNATKVATKSTGGRSVDFFRDVKPILEAKCGKCHGAETKKAKLDLSTEQTIIAGGKSGPVVVLGKPAESPLHRRIIDKKDPMPPADEAMQLTAEEIKTIEEWILQGTVSPSGAK